MFEKIGREKDVRAVVLASSLPRVFSAGLDCEFRTRSPFAIVVIEISSERKISLCVGRVPNF